MFIFFCEKENEPTEIARRDAALNGRPFRFTNLCGRCGTQLTLLISDFTFLFNVILVVEEGSAQRAEL